MKSKATFAVLNFKNVNLKRLFSPTICFVSGVLKVIFPAAETYWVVDGPVMRVYHSSALLRPSILSPPPHFLSLSTRSPFEFSHRSSTYDRLLIRTLQSPKTLDTIALLLPSCLVIDNRLPGW